MMLGLDVGRTTTDTARIIEEQRETVVVVDSGADTDYRILAITAPRKPWPVSVEAGWRWFEQGDVREYNSICIQDGKADLYQVKRE
jgi:hypothetical protein